MFLLQDPGDPGYRISAAEQAKSEGTEIAKDGKRARAHDPGPSFLLEGFTGGLRPRQIESTYHLGSRSSLFNGHPIPQEVDDKDNQDGDEKDYNDRFGTISPHIQFIQLQSELVNLLVTQLG